MDSLGTRRRNAYYLVVAQNFLSSLSRQYPYKVDNGSVDAKSPTQSLEINNTTNCFETVPTNEVLLSEQTSCCEAHLLPIVKTDVSRSLSSLNSFKEAKLYPPPEVQCISRQQSSVSHRHLIVETPEPPATVARCASDSAASNTYNSSSFEASDVLPSERRARLKKFGKKGNNESALLLSSESATHRQNQTDENEPPSSGKSFNFLKRWRAFTANGSGERVRHLSCTSFDATDIRPIDFSGVQEVSFGKLLLPEDANITTHDRSPIRGPSTPVSFSISIPQNRKCSVAIEEAPSNLDSKSVKGNEKGADRDVEDSSDTGTSSGFREKFSSFSFPLKATTSNEMSTAINYDPDLLFNFERENSFHKTTLKFNGSVSALFSSCSEEEAKRLMNEKFHVQYPHVQITYSKIKSIKKEMFKIARACNLDDLTLAHSYVFYEKVVLKGVVKKVNRKLVAGAALLVAVKINDHGSMRLSSIVDHIEMVFRINRKDMLQLEIPLCVALDFNLYATEAELLPHYQRISLMDP